MPGPQLQVLSASRTAATATIGAATALTGDSLVIANFDKTKRAYLLNAWMDSQAAGALQIRSSRMHDNQRGIRLDHIASDVQPFLPRSFKQPLFSGDTIVVEFSGSAVAGDVETVSLLVYYEEVDGGNGRFIDGPTLMKRAVNLVGVENTITSVAGPGYSGGEALNAESDLLVAGYDYAILGYLVDTECCSVTWRGPDTGNVRVGGPGCETSREFTRSWFSQLSEDHGIPLIPVINANNRASTFIEVAQDENAAAVTVITLLAQLS